MIIAEQVAAARTLLFVPGDVPERFPKARASGADVVILDLEDAVAPDCKSAARDAVAGWLGAHPDTVVRINAFGSPWYDDDVALVADRGCAVMPAKVDDPAQLRDLGARLHGGAALIPLIETAAAVLAAPQICAVPGVVRTAFGHLDLALQLGVDPGDRDALLTARSAVVLAATAAGIAAPVDGVTMALKDAEVIGDDAAHAARLGFTGKLCVHPAQIAPAAAAFTPTDADVEWARGVIGSVSGAVGSHAGELVDKPVIDRARHLLARHEQATGAS